MSIAVLKPLDQIKTWTLDNAAVRMDIEQDTGFIRSLLFKQKNVDLFQQLRAGIPGYIGGLRIFDERDEVWYEDLRTEFSVSNAEQRGNTVSFTKHYAGAPFAVHVRLILEQDFFHWEVEAQKTEPSVPDRSLRVHFSMPIIAGWHLWAPCLAGERTFDGMTTFEHCYTQISYVSDSEVILPMISHYNKELDVGFSMLEPIDGKVPAAKFLFQNAERGFTWRATPKLHNVPVLETVNYYIGLVKDRPMRTKIMLAFHEGDWRPALGQVFHRWKKFFVPKNKRMYEMEGMFDGFCVHWDQKTTPEKVARHGGKLFEVHGHFSFYGDYYQDGLDRWLDVCVTEHVRQKLEGKPDAWAVLKWIESHTPQEVVALIDGGKPEDYTPAQAEARMYTTREFVKKTIRGLSRHGVHPFWYFNYTDGFRPVMEERWKDSICRNEDGSYQPSGWFMCHNMNSDPKYPFGKFQIESAKKILKAYPELDGFFLDCFRHFEVDFAHDDGITVVNNRPAYSVNFSYDDIEVIIEKMLLERDLCTFANKPQTIRSMRWVDGMMLEGDGDRMEEKYFYSCVAKPIIFLWTSNAATDDENCRRSVLYGCYPRVVYGPETPASKGERRTGKIPETVERRNHYMPLYDQFRRRVFCFEPDPVRVPKGNRVKLYTAGKDYIAGIVNLNIDDTMTLKYKKTQYAMFRVSRGYDVGKVGIMLPGSKKWKLVKFKFNGTVIAVPLEGYTNCAAVKLFVTKNSGRKIGPEKFKGAVDSCGDPDSSFTDLSKL